MTLKREMLASLLEKHPTIVISTPGCPACTQAKQLFESQKISFHEVNRAELPPQEQAELLSEVAEKYSQKTFPVIFLRGEFIGTFDALKARLGKQ